MDDIVTGLRVTLGRFNSTHPWSHNDAYSGFILRHARAARRRGGSTAVDVGCGTGDLLNRLASVFPCVIGIEADPQMARIAAERSERASTVTVDHRPFGDEPPDSYDLILFVASLHHMPLRSTLLEARAALSARGRIVIVGVARETREDVLPSFVSLVLNPLVGLMRHPQRAAGTPARMNAPSAEATESFSEIRRIAREILPGVRMRRGLFWRYTAIWTAPPC